MRRSICAILVIALLLVSMGVMPPQSTASAVDAER